jgi:hypothetical protein
MTARLAALVLALSLWSATARAADPREIDAREAFVTGHYQKALELFGKLYAETLHPTYLRNIARCYQKLGDADHALTTFHDYLRKVPELPARDRAEIDEYVAEMEALKRKQAPPGPMVPRAATSAPAPAISAPALSAPPESPHPSRWWLWTGLAVVVAGAAVVAGVVLTRPADAGCPAGSSCYRP